MKTTFPEGLGLSSVSVLLPEAHNMRATCTLWPVKPLLLLLLVAHGRVRICISCRAFLRCSLASCPGQQAVGLSRSSQRLTRVLDTRESTTRQNPETRRPHDPSSAPLQLGYRPSH